MKRAGLVAGAVVLLGAALPGCSRPQEVPDAVGPTAPLEAYLDEIWGDREWDPGDGDPDAADPTRLLAEELVAACMAEAGFEYHPMVEMPSYVSISPQPRTVEDAEEFGYGLSIESAGPGTGTGRWAASPQETPAERANREYKESLSPAARMEYELALMGDPGAALEEGYDPATDGGCQGRAYEEAGRTVRPPEFAEVIEAMDQAFWQAEEDPRVVDARRGWGPCMAEAGYPGLDQFTDARILADSMVSSFRAANADRIDLGLAESQYDAIKASVPDELAELQAAERALAVADVTCRETSGYDRVHREVTAEYEQQVVDRYRDELEAWAARERAEDRASG